jgi:predicted DNA-binding transcriptional regulator
MFFLQLARMRVFFLINRLITRREFIRAGKVGYFLPRERD